MAFSTDNEDCYYTTILPLNSTLGEQSQYGARIEKSSSVIRAMWRLKCTPTSQVEKIYSDSPSCKP